MLLFLFLIRSFINFDHKFLQKFVRPDPRLLFLLVACVLEERIKSFGLDKVLKKQYEITFYIVYLVS